MIHYPDNIRQLATLAAAGAVSGHELSPSALHDQSLGVIHTVQGVGSGTGLGLVIARKMLARMGATIDLESRLGEGTRVVLRFQPTAD